MSSMWVKSRVWVPGETTVRVRRSVLCLEEADHRGVLPVLIWPGPYTL